MVATLALMGRMPAVRNGLALWAVVLLTAFLVIGSRAGLGSARSAYAARATPCKPRGREAVTLRLNAHAQTVRADVGDTIEVVVHLSGVGMSVPSPLDHKRAVCRVFRHRVSPSKVIATFLVRRAARKITFGSFGMTSRKGCPGCPHAVARIGYARIGAPAPASTY